MRGGGRYGRSIPSLVIVAAVLWAGYYKWKSGREPKESLYRRYKADHFLSESDKERKQHVTCPICGNVEDILS